VGTGGAFDFRQRNSSALMSFRGMAILLDCGADVFTTLRGKGAADDITHILITHLHDDHAGSLGSILCYHTLILKKPKLQLIYPTEAFRQHLFNFLSFIIAKPDDHVEWIPMDAVPGIEFVDTTGLHVKDFPTFGYIFTEDGKTIAYSGDIGDGHFIFNQLEQRGLKGSTVFHDITFNPANKAHAFYKDVASHVNDFEVYGYHLDPDTEPGDNPLALVSARQDLML
jgi:ribonuclease BN (tRNA processing enzyme)